MNTFDRIIQENINALALGIIKRTLGLEIKDFQPVDRKIQKTHERETDFLVIVQDENTHQPYMIHIEFQTTNDKDMAQRMYMYDALIEHKFRLLAKQLVIYIGENPPQMATTIRRNSFTFQYELVWSKNFTYQDFLSSETPEEVLFALLADFQQEDSHTVVNQILNRLKELTPDGLRLQKYIVQLNILSQLRNLEDVTTKISKQMLTFDINRVPILKEAIDKGVEQGMAQGMEKGMAQGIAQGIEIAKRENVINMLKLGVSKDQIALFLNVSHDFIETIEKSND